MSIVRRRATGNLQKHQTRTPVQRRLIDRFHGEVVRLLGQAPPGAVLELGCGEGFVLEALVEAGVDATLVGIDRSAEAADQARRRLGSRAEIIRRDLRHVDDLPQMFDAVLMLEVLEHLDDPPAALDLLASLTTGRVLVSVPREPFFRGLNLLRLKNVRLWGSDPDHVQHWTRSQFERLVSTRFAIVERGRTFPWTLLLLEPRPGPDLP